MSEFNTVMLGYRTVPRTFTEAKRVESRLLQDLINGKFEIPIQSKNPKFSDYAKDYIKSVPWQKSHRRTVQLVNNLVKSAGQEITDTNHNTGLHRLSHHAIGKS